MKKMSEYVEGAVEYGPDTVVAEGPDGTLFLVHRYFPDVPEIGEYLVDEFVIDHIPSESEARDIIAHGAPDNTTPWVEWTAPWVESKRQTPTAQ